MQKVSSRFQRNDGMTLLEAAIVIIVLLFVAALLFPIFASTRHYTPKSSCQSNLKELATALQMYWNDYDGLLPSSALHQSVNTDRWNARKSAEFCAELGPLPPAMYPLSRDIHWPQVLWPHMKNKDIIWCPRDPARPHYKEFLGLNYGRVEPSPQSLISYIYKPAVDRAWYGVPQRDGSIKNYRKEGDFEFVADQVIFFEHTGWHWGDSAKGWKDGVSLNAAFLDGHVRNIRLTNAVDCPTPKTANELAGLLSRGGEPLWFNFDSTKPFEGSSYRGECKVIFDPGRYYDNLP